MGRIVGQVVAFDPDTQGDVVYTFMNVSAPFGIDSKSGVIKVLGPLDRESVPEYSLEVQANDGIHSSYHSVLIQLDDENDNDPFWTQNQITFTVLENSPRGTFVGQLNAQDPDFGPNGTVQYRWAPKSVEVASQLLNLHPETGFVTLSAFVDYEEVLILFLSPL